VGRGEDLSAIARHFDERARLLTLLGPAGTGKTRLALRYGHGALGNWPGGIWFCDLSDATTLDGVLYATASALGVRLTAGDGAAQLIEAIAARGRCLVVLDNFEQVVQHAGATVARWVEAHDAAFMVTSRERLHVPGEVVQSVEPLPIDGPAVDLFVARARAVRHDFAPDAAERHVIARVVKMLDGLPLAIELAAARIALLSPAQLLERLRDRFRLLAGRRGVSRQSTLRAAIDWSWQLLAPWEQAALEQCSVFEGGFTLAAAEAVIDLAAWPEAPPVIEAMQALVDKSLLRRWIPPDAQARHDIEEPYFGMYISIHEYADEKCRSRGAGYQGAVHERHGAFFAAFGTDAALEALFTHGGTQRLRTLRRELDNLLLACRRAILRADGETAVACYRAAWEALAMRGPFGIAVAMGDEILAIRELDVRLAEQARLTLAEALTRTGATEGLEAKLGEALERVRAIGDRKLEARVLGRLGNMCQWTGRVDQAQAYYERALECARMAGHRLLEARMHGNLGITHDEHGRREEAVAHYEAALAMEREIGSRRDEAITLCNLANLLGAQGQTERARATFAAALALLRELGDRDTEAITLQVAGEFELGQGLVEEAERTLRAALELTQLIGNRSVHGQGLRSLGGALVALGQYDDARSAIEQGLAIARAASNRRIEANCVAALGDLAFRLGRHGDAAGLLSEAETTLRDIDDPPLLADLLCTRGLVDLARGDPAAARSALAEAQRIAGEMHVGPASSLGRAVERLHAAMEGAAHAT
jgi:predicted ATPase/Tfp pilus assembly protein PilF